MKRAVALAALLLLSACASVTKGTEQTVMVETPEVPGASCLLKDTKFREWTVKSTPGSALVRKGDGPMTVVCNKEGYATATEIVAESFEAMTVGNVLIGGVVGVVIDAASGAAEKYPELIQVYMNRLTGDVSATSGKADPAPENPRESEPQLAAKPVKSVFPDRRPPRPGLQRLNDEEIRLIFKDTRIDNYPDRWNMEFTADGKWEGLKHGSRMIHGYGTWTVRNRLHCLSIDDHDGYAYENVEPGSCYEVWVDEKKALIRMVDPRDRRHPILAKENAYAEVDLLQTTKKRASETPKASN